MKYIFILVAMVLGSAAARAETKTVVVTIKPLHSLVAAVMQGDGNTPVLLVDGKQSLHTYSLKPSQREALEHAAVVFYISKDFETFMDKTLAALPKTVLRASMEDVPAVTLFTQRTGEGFEAHNHETPKKQSNYDLHLWTSPTNAKLMLPEIARQLTMAFPEKKQIYFDNVRRLSNRLELLDRDLDMRMRKVWGKPFIVFHDADQYFEKMYQLKNMGAITTHPEQGVSAGRLQAIREKIKSGDIRCVFREPQFDSKMVNSLIEGSSVKSGVLDAEGALLTPGPELYFELIEGLAKAYESCLS